MEHFDLDKINCPLCKRLGVSKSFVFETYISFPEEVQQLSMIKEFSGMHDLRQCPYCHQYYEFSFEHDNEPFQPWYYAEFKRIPEKEAEEMLGIEIKTAQSQNKKNITTCPKCNSKSVSQESVGIEFTKLTCNHCGYMVVADVWDKSEWDSK